jgi:hypothetical protein
VGGHAWCKVVSLGGGDDSADAMFWVKGPLLRRVWGLLAASRLLMKMPPLPSRGSMMHWMSSSKVPSFLRIAKLLSSINRIPTPHYTSPTPLPSNNRTKSLSFTRLLLSGPLLSLLLLGCLVFADVFGLILVFLAIFLVVAAFNRSYFSAGSSCLEGVRCLPCTR